MIKDLRKRGIFSSPDFFAHASDTIEKRLEEETTRELLNSIHNWYDFCIIFNNRLETYQRKYLSKTAKNEISKFEESRFTLSIFSFEVYRLLQASAVCAVAGYFESAYILLRNAIERAIQMQFFTIDFRAYKKWKNGKLKILMTGKGGLIDKLSDPQFIKDKVGVAFPLILDERQRGAIQTLYRRYSEAVHGKVLGATDIFGAVLHSKKISEFTHRLEKIEQEYSEFLLKNIKPILDHMALLSLTTAILLSKANVLENISDGERRLQEILVFFPMCQDVINSYRRLVKEKAQANQNLS